ncbi:MAG: 2-keto-3-deoxy-L-rhamnonate aldolase RhmA [Candidatus Azotimanducaceae bacterium]|jgi:2-keto-3-deoxy-L-rhamnonate aldolase RhmA
MRQLSLFTVVLLLSSSGPVISQESEHISSRANPLVAIHEARQSIFGLYAPANRTAIGNLWDLPQKLPSELAKETLGFNNSDFVFTGSMESSLEQRLPAWIDYVESMIEAGATIRTHPIIVKTPKIADDYEAATQNIALQLDTGAAGIMFVTVESAEEVEHGLRAMRYKSNGGLRPDESVGDAPAYWGMSDEEYKDKADLWPANPDGELINWTVVESAKGLENVREIAAVDGISVLWPGAGTLRRLFSTENDKGERVTDEEAWENAIQQVLGACKEFDVPCGYPATTNDIEMRMAQGFSVFVMAWGENGFTTIDIGKSASRDRAKRL